MDAYDRENLVGWGQAFAAWQSRSATQGLLLGSLIEAEHTRYMVTKQTGDARLGNRVGAFAGLRLFGGIVLAFAAAFVASVLVLFTLGPFVAIPVGFVVLILLSTRAIKTMDRNAHARQPGNLPSENDLNRAGYWQVEPDVWFNSVTNRVLMGHAYDATEAQDARAAYRDEDRQIKAMYKANKRRPRPQTLTQPLPGGRTWTKTRRP